MGARKSVDKILDDAANILEKHGFTTTKCFNPTTGGFCALGAVARAAYPKASISDIDMIAYVETPDDAQIRGFKLKRRYVAAVKAMGEAIKPGQQIGAGDLFFTVYRYNDRAKSSKDVVDMLRRAAENARKTADA